MKRISLVLLATLATVSPAAGPPEVSEKDLAASNNPLSGLNAVDFQNTYTPSIFGLPDKTANTMNLRGIKTVGRHIIRATLPVVSQPSSAGIDRSGLGDSNIFDVLLLSPDGAPLDYGVGPLLVMPTATSGDTGAGKWQGGASAAVVKPLSGGSVVGSLVTWQASFAGHEDRQETNIGTTQLIANLALSAGYYLRSSPVMVFDFQNDRYLIPWGLGLGKVFKTGAMMANAFFEAQPALYHKGDGQPAMQLYMGLNLQWKS